ncbi:MAG: MaoC family dehydratase [Actinomycetota bacterium]
MSNAVLCARDVEVGQELPHRTVHIDRESLVQYTGASLDRNRIHWDERFARSVGLPDVIAHGMFTMGTVINVVSDWVGDAGRVVEYGTRFTKPVVVPYEGGADVEVTGVVTALDAQTRRATVELKAMCGTDRVLGRAVAVVVLD